MALYLTTCCCFLLLHLARLDLLEPLGQLSSSLSCWLSHSSSYSGLPWVSSGSEIQCHAQKSQCRCMTWSCQASPCCSGSQTGRLDASVLPCNSSQSWRNVCSRCWSRIFFSWFIAVLLCLLLRGLRFAGRSIDGRDVVLQPVSHLLLFLQQGLHVVYLLRLQLHGDRHHGLYSLFIGKDVDSKCFGFLAAASTAARSKPKLLWETRRWFRRAKFCSCQTFCWTWPQAASALPTQATSL